MKATFTKFRIALISTFSYLLISSSAYAQTPQKMSYQAVVRNSNNQLVANQKVGMQISILQGSATGTFVYSEMQTPTTNANGLVSIEFGGGTGFSSIDWPTGSYFIQTETDPTGGTNYTITGTSQILSVPYALHAKTAETVTGGIIEIDPTFTSSEAANITATDITKLSNLSGVNTGDQNLSSLATKAALGDSTALVRSQIPDVSGFLTSYTETDPTFKGSVAANITATDITKLSNLSGVNTGDQNLSSLATKAALGDSTALVRSQIPDVSGFLTSYTETDPTFKGSVAANITATDITKLSNLSGVNTGDQNLSSLATKAALSDSITLLRSEIPVAADGSETKVTAGTNVTVTGTGTTVSPYVINSVQSLTQVQRDALTPYEGLIVYNSTTKKPNYYNGTEWMNYNGTSAKTFAIGVSYQGGIVFYIFQSGDPGYIAGETHGLIAATSNQSTSLQWYNGSFNVTGATATVLGSGIANTNAIISSQGAGSYAAQLCADLDISGYSDWYLPSKDELNKLYLNRAAVSGIVGEYYWSSREFDINNAWAQNLGNGTQTPYGKNGAIYVCAIRAF